MTPNPSSYLCERARAQISARLDGELSDLEGAELSRHLTACGSCRTYAADVGSFSRVLRTAPVEELDFPIAIPRRRHVVAARIQIGAAAAAALAMVALGALHGGLGSRALTSSTGLGGTQAARPAYLDSAVYEQRLIKAALAAHSRAHTGSAVAT